MHGACDACVHLLGELHVQPFEFFVLRLELEALLFGFREVDNEHVSLNLEHRVGLHSLFDDSIGFDAGRLTLLLGVQSLANGLVVTGTHP